MVQPADIDLSIQALPLYTLYSLGRGLAAFGLSLGFTLCYGYWAAKDRLAERALIPLLDVLQSIPVLGFMPGLVLALVAAFPGTSLGLELAAVLMIFTGQAWNMTFSYYYCLKTVPHDLAEASTIYRFTWWQRLRLVEIPYATIGLVWNSMMSMAGGWFFLMISEAFVLGDRDFRLPGLGSYMSVAVARGDTVAMLAAIGAMVVMILFLDQALWRPLVVWSQKFRVEEGGQEAPMRSWVYDWVRRSRLLGWLALRLAPRARVLAAKPGPASIRWARPASIALLGALLLGLLIGAVRLGGLLREVTISNWLEIAGSALITLGRVLAATALGTLWAVPAGLAIGLSPRLSRLLQPVVQVVASFPAPMLFPAVIAVLKILGVQLGWGSILLMLLGTQWYILFNVLAGASAMPADLREMAHSYRIRGWHRYSMLYLPAIFPYLITGWITAAGGAWNASIVAEHVTFRGEVMATDGLGARISAAATAASLPQLAASVVVMAVIVVAFNRLVWNRLHHLAATRYSFDK